jgi:spore germination protein YaaH
MEPMNPTGIQRPVGVAGPVDRWTDRAIFWGVRPLKFLFFGFFATVRALPAQQLEALWYSNGAERSTASFLAHAEHVSIVSPQVFSFDNEGAIHGRLDRRLVDTARAKGVKLVPLVVNPGFSQPLIHRILNVAAVRQRALESLVALCRDQHLDGIQFDIENVNVVDKDAFTRFVRDASARLHAANCSVSAAVVPRTGEDPGPSVYHKWIFENWRGAYDYKALAESLDFLSYMTYAQHTGGTPPGPVAGFPWMEECLKYVLSLGVPPSKISLGIPSYSDHWYAFYDSAGGARSKAGDSEFWKVDSLVKTFHANLVWDDREKSSYAFWSNAGVFEHVWIEDARAFAAKLELVRKYKLRGYSVWVLGTEDPKIWELK